MRNILRLATSLAAVAGLTAHADEANDAPATADPFAVALAVLNGEPGTGGNASEALPPLVNHSQGRADSPVSSASLADGQVSSFRIGMDGSDQVTVCEANGLWVGATAVDTHVIEITSSGWITAGTYTLIDYEGAIGGAGFEGLVLRSGPRLHAELVNNTAETRIELVVSKVDDLEWPATAGSIWNLGDSNNRMPFYEDGAARGNIGIFDLAGPAAMGPAKDALQ